LAIALSVVLRFTNSDYLFGILKLLLQNNCERDRKRKKKRKKYKRSKEKYGSKRDKNKSTELINENERNVSNYTEPEIDGILITSLVS
jgi:hypothetical protein